MLKLTAIAALSGISLCGQYKTEPAGVPPAELAASVKSLLLQDGVKIVKPDGSVLAEVWMRSAEPAGGAKEDNTSFTTIPLGAVLGAIRFPGRHYDRRGQTVKPGVYAMRYGLFPVNGDHQGVAPQRDFLVLCPGAAADGAAVPGFEPLMEMSREASGTPHPLVLSFWKAEGGATAGFHEIGEHDMILNTKLGNTMVSIILIGKAEG